MSSLRCTAKLRRKLGLGTLPEPGPGTAALGDWTANLLTLDRQPLVLCVSERSLLAVVLPARDLKNLSRHFLRGLEERLRRLGIAEATIARELAHFQPLAFAATNSRSVLGSMNDFIYQLGVGAAYEPGWRWSVAELEDDLGRIPCAPIDYERPEQRARALLGADETSVPKGAEERGQTPTHRLRVTLQGIQPAIWREIEIPSRATLRDLHEVLQSAFGWEGAHLWLFKVAGESFAPPELEFERARDDRRVRLSEALPAVGAEGRYLYDMGDSWSHRIEVRAIEPDGGTTPRCLDGARAAPPEDCGGVPGYELLLEALAGGGGADGAELRDNAEGYDPESFSRAAADRELARLPVGLGPRRA